MIMRVASHQPVFLPWAGFWHKACSVDHFVLSAGVQWAKDCYLNRIKHAGAWLTLPVNAKDSDRILDVRVASDRRRLAKTWKTVDLERGPYRSRLDPIVDRLCRIEPGERLVDVNL